MRKRRREGEEEPSFKPVKASSSQSDELGTEWLLPQEARAARAVAEGGLARTGSGQTSEKSGRPLFFSGPKKESDAGLQQ